MAPIEEIPGGVRNVLDIGTGTGIWAIDFGMAPLYLVSSYSIVVPCIPLPYVVHDTSVSISDC